MGITAESENNVQPYFAETCKLETRHHTMSRDAQFIGIWFRFYSFFPCLFAMKFTGILRRNAKYYCLLISIDLREIDYLNGTLKNFFCTYWRMMNVFTQNHFQYLSKGKGTIPRVARCLNLSSTVPIPRGFNFIPRAT